ncbi:MAG: hypothetical protein WBD36_01190 [Bacteroidota bacterium]
MDKIEPEPLQEEPRGATLKRLAVVILFAAIAFFAYDWSLNNKHFANRIIYWNDLSLHSQHGGTWSLKANQDFQLLELTDTSRSMSESVLQEIDAPFRERGLYRVYFRISDAESDKLQRIMNEISLIDTGRSVEKTIEQIKKSYEGARRLFTKDSLVKGRDTLTILSSDSTGKPLKTDVLGGSEDEVRNQLSVLVKRNPQVLIGLGVGLAASAGIMLLEGQTFLATAPQDVFRVDSLQCGPRAGMWEGKAIDILWAFKKPATN